MPNNLILVIFGDEYEKTTWPFATVFALFGRSFC